MSPRSRATKEPKPRRRARPPGLLVGALLAAPAAGFGGWQVDAEFEGGSGRTLSVDEGANIVRIQSVNPDDRGWACWWHVRIRGLTPQEPFQLEVSVSPDYRDRFNKALSHRWAAPDQAAVSEDGVHWRHTAPGAREDSKIRYTIRPNGAAIYAAWGPPFVPNNARAWTASIAARRNTARAFTLCVTREGRATPALRHQPKIAPDNVHRFPAVWVQARQHAWESGSSWVAKGLGDWMFGDSDAAQTLRAQAEIVIVPIMDVDNAAQGFGGKNARPHDHNRDWSETPHWPAVAAAQDALKRYTAAGRPVIFLDLHNPGAGHRRPFFYLYPRDMMAPERRAATDQFIQRAKARIVDPLPLAETQREAGPDYATMWDSISGTWVNQNTTPQSIGLCLETPWNTPASLPPGYETVGRQLAETVAAHVAQVYAGSTQ